MLVSTPVNSSFHVLFHYPCILPKYYSNPKNAPAIRDLLESYGCEGRDFWFGLPGDPDVNGHHGLITCTN